MLKMLLVRRLMTLVLMMMMMMMVVMVMVVMIAFIRDARKILKTSGSLTLVLRMDFVVIADFNVALRMMMMMMMMITMTSLLLRRLLAEHGNNHFLVGHGAVVAARLWIGQ